METVYKQNVKVLSSMTNSNAEVGISHALSYLQDNMSEYMGSLNCDGITMIPKANCFWVMTKSKIRFNGRVKWLDSITLKTYLSHKSPARLNIVNDILDRDGNVIIEGIQELCAMDSDTRKIRLIKSTLFPEDIKPLSTNKDIEFSKLDFELDESKFKKEVTVSSENIDYFGHANNVEYSRFILSTFGGDELKMLNPKTFEIHYIAESKEGDKLSIFMDKVDKKYLFEIKRGEKVCVKAIIEIWQIKYRNWHKIRNYWQKEVS